MTLGTTAFFRSLRASHPSRVRRMLRHFIADRTKQTAAAHLADIGISTRRKLKGRCRLQTANLTARNAVAALVAAEKAGSDVAKGSEEHKDCSLLPDDDSLVSRAMIAAARRALRRRRRVSRRAHLAVGGYGTETSIHSRLRRGRIPLQAFTSADSTRRTIADMSFTCDGVMHGTKQTGKAQGKQSASQTTASLPAVYYRWGTKMAYNYSHPAIAKTVQRASARSAFFAQQLREYTSGAGECSFSSRLRLIQCAWAGQSSKLKNALVPERVRQTVLGASNRNKLAYPVPWEAEDAAVAQVAPHISKEADDCLLLTPHRPSWVHILDIDAEHMPHVLPHVHRSSVNRLVRSPFQMFVDAHIDMARAEVLSAFEANKLKHGDHGTSGSNAPVAEGGVESSKSSNSSTNSLAAGSHAVTVAAVKSLADGWMELRPADREAYTSVAEGYSVTSRRYFDEAFRHLRLAHRTRSATGWRPPSPCDGHEESSGCHYYSTVATPEGVASRRSSPRRNRGKHATGQLPLYARNKADDHQRASTDNGLSKHRILLPLSPIVLRRRAEASLPRTMSSAVSEQC